MTFGRKSVIEYLINFYRQTLRRNIAQIISHLDSETIGAPAGWLTVIYLDVKTRIMIFREERQ
jgi:hypothetical protein